MFSAKAQEITVALHDAQKIAKGEAHLTFPSWGGGHLPPAMARRLTARLFCSIEAVPGVPRWVSKGQPRHSTHLLNNKLLAIMGARRRELPNSLELNPLRLTREQQPRWRPPTPRTTD